jgi:hypothetical protein
MLSRPLFAFLGVAMVAACSAGSEPSNDAGPPVEAGVADQVVVDAPAEADVSVVDAGYPGPHPDVPQVQNNGGPVLTTPTVIPIFFASDPYQSNVEMFLGQLAASTFWGSATSEYMAGPLTIGTSIVVTDTPPVTTTTSQIEAWLVSYLDGTHPEFPPVALDNIYTIFYPSSTTISDTELGTSCTDYGGYHDEAKSTTNESIVYAVLPRCAMFGQLTGLDALTGPLSHEMMEASTDPLVGTNPAWVSVDTDHMVWNIRPLGEIGDMCAYEPQSFERLVGSFMVQRPWSNASALAGHDPCVPVLSTPYYNAGPVLTDTVMLDYYGQLVPTKGIQIPLGQSATIDVQVFSDAPTTQWSVEAVDSNYGTANPTELTFTWDTQYGNNGDTLHLTITRIANGTTFEGTEFFLYATRDSKTWNMWFGFVGN